MKLSLLFMKIWYFEAIHCLNFSMQRQKGRDVTNDVKVNFKFLIYGSVGCLQSIIILPNILFFIIRSMCAMEFTEKMTLIHSCLEFV